MSQWRAVPTEAAEESLQAAVAYQTEPFSFNQLRDVYRAMVAAAPAPPTESRTRTPAAASC